WEHGLPAMASPGPSATPRCLHRGQALLPQFCSRTRELP
ncbi:hypothetical protein, partial [Pseudomonas sp. FG-3G]